MAVSKSKKMVDSSKEMWSGKNSSDSTGIWLFPPAIRASLGPLMLMISTPITSIILSRAVTSEKFNGEFIPSTIDTLTEMYEKGITYTLTKDAFDPYAWKVILTYMLVQLVLMRVLPGKKFVGPISPMGNRPIYKDNCVLCYIVSFLLFALGSHYGYFKAGVAFHYFPQIIASLNLFAFAFCAMLYVKGAVAPSSSDSGLSGNAVFDFYWGAELYPRIFGWDVKVFTNCRFSMTGWALLCASFACAQYEKFGYVSNSILISAALQIIYLLKFHIWETGYYLTIDIMHDRAGYYICWGVLVWVPSLYTAHTAFLVLHPHNFSLPLAFAQLFFGLASIGLNYYVDQQRQEFRAKSGKMKIWGKDAEYIVAPYTTEDGKKHSSLLLCSGWWSLARKLNYFFELCAAFSWSIVFANPTYLIPYFYFVFLLILLVDRAWRDDARCASKYGKKWDEYCDRVPSMLIPGIF